MRHQLQMRGNSYVAMAAISASATYSCKHNITKLPICATPCNGIPEMCQYDVDEQCQGLGLELILLLSLAFSVTNSAHNA